MANMSIIKQMAMDSKTCSSTNSTVSSFVADALEEFHDEGLIRLAAIDNRFHLARQFDDDYEWTNNEAGRGHTGIVRVAERIGGVSFEGEIGTFRCVKSMRKRSQVGRDPEEIEEELKRQCSVYMSVDHPNIARLMDVYEDDFYITMVMEYCSGGTLEDRIVSRGFIEEELASKWLFHILLAIRYLHLKCIAHRDIKPLNLVFVDDSDSSVLKLIDFDVSATCPDVDTGDMLRGGSGTPAYMSPEIFKNLKDCGNWYDTKTDLWSLGVTLFKMLSGSEPFKAPGFWQQAAGDSEGCDSFEMEEWMEDIMSGNYSFDADQWRSISASGKDLVQQLLKVDAYQRPTAADAMRHPWLDGRKEERVRITFGGEALASSIINAFVAFLEVPQDLRQSLQTLCYSKVDFDMQGILPIFGFFDRKCEGQIDLQDFAAALRGLGAKNDLGDEFTDAQCEDLFDKLTSCFEEKTGKRPFGFFPPLQYSEFMAAVLPVITQPAFVPMLTDGHGIGLSVLDIEHDLRTAFNIPCPMETS